MDDCGNHSSARGRRPPLRKTKDIGSIPIALNGAARRRVIKDLILAVKVLYQVSSGFEIGFPKRRQGWRAISVQIQLGSGSTSRVPAVVMSFLAA